MTNDEILNTLRTTTAALLWRQWGALGGMTNATGSRRVVDPEALVLGTLALPALEPRAVEVARSWIWHNHDRINVPRLRGLARHFPTATGALIELAALADAAGGAPWKQLAGRPASSQKTTKPRDRAVRTRLVGTPTLMLTMRMGVGVTARADILTYLIANSGMSERWASVSRIATTLGYTVAAVRRAADAMAEADFVESLAGVGEGRGRAARMYRVRGNRWNGMLSLSDLGWSDWQETYRLVADLEALLAKAPPGTVTPYILSGWFGVLMAKYPGAIPETLSDPPALPEEVEEWPEYLGGRLQRWQSSVSYA